MLWQYIWGVIFVARIYDKCHVEPGECRKTPQPTLQELTKEVHLGHVVECMVEDKFGQAWLDYTVRVRR